MTTSSSPAGAGDRLLIALLAATALVLVVGYTYLSFSIAAEQEEAVIGLLVIAAAPALLAMAARPSLVVAALAAALLANAGLVLNAQFGVPSVVRGLVVVGVLMALVRPQMRGGLFRQGPVFVALAIYVAVRLLTAASAPRAVDLPDVAQDLAYGLAIVALLALAGTRLDWARQTALLTVAAAAVLSAVALAREYGLLDETFGFAEYQALTPDLLQIVNRSLIPIDVAGRIGGPVGEPNFWAQILVFIAPVALWSVWRRGGRSRAVAIVGVILIALAVVETSSRGGLLSFGVALIVLCLLAGGRARKFALLVPIALVVALVASGNVERFTAITQVTNPAAAEDEAVRGRASENLAAIEMLGDNLVTGVGAGNYSVAYLEYAAEVGLDSRNVERQAHNSYLEAAAESGLAGGVAFLALMIVGVAGPARAQRRLHAAGRREAAGLATAVAAGFAGYATGAVFLHQGYPEYTWLALGLSAMATTLARARPLPEESA